MMTIDLNEIRKRDHAKYMNKLAQKWENWDGLWINQVPKILGKKPERGTHNKNLVSEKPSEAKVL